MLWPEVVLYIALAYIQATESKKNRCSFSLFRSKTSKCVEARLTKHFLFSVWTSMLRKVQFFFTIWNFPRFWRALSQIFWAQSHTPSPLITAAMERLFWGIIFYTLSKIFEMQEFSALNWHMWTPRAIRLFTGFARNQSRSRNEVKELQSPFFFVWRIIGERTMMVRSHGWPLHYGQTALNEHNM